MTVHNRVAAIKSLFHRKREKGGGVDADLQRRYDEAVRLEQGDEGAVAREEARAAERAERFRFEA